MFCAQCGVQNPDGGKFCSACGKPLEAPTPAAAPTANLGGLLAAGFVPPPTTSGKAVASLIFGFLFFVFPAAVAAIVLGHLSLSEIRKSAGRIRGHGIAVAGLVFGYLGVLMIPFILIVAAIAIPNLLRSRMAANQASAVGALRDIDRAAISYSSSYGNGYPPDLETLSGLGTQNCDHAGLIDGELASGFRHGYIIRYRASEDDNSLSARPKGPAPGCSVAGAAGYAVTADPVTRGTTGQNSYYTDQTGVIRYETDGTASADSAPLE